MNLKTIQLKEVEKKWHFLSFLTYKIKYFKNITDLIRIKI